MSMISHAQQAGDDTDVLKADDILKNKRAERILHDFVPDIESLSLIKGKELKKRYKGVLIKGIYNVTPHGDQRYVERFSQKGQIAYKEGEFSSTGRWYVKGDNLCFRYDEIPDREHCFYEFDYGDCIISYANDRLVLAGKPLEPRRWSSVNKVAEKGFSWDNLTFEEAKEFSCYSLVS